MNRHGTRARVILVAGATLLGSPPRAAAAEDGGLALRLLRHANQRCAGKRAMDALPLYEQALKAKALPQIHLAFGECLRRVGRCDQAIEQYRQYQQAATNRKNRKGRHHAQALIKLCQEEQRRQQRSAAVPAIAPVEQAPPPAAAPPRAMPRAAGTRPASTAAGSRRHLHPGYFWTGVGTAVAMVAVGTACGVAALEKSGHYNDYTTPASELQGLKDTGEALKLASTITFAVGGAAAVASAVLYFFTRFERGEAVSAAPVQGGAMVVMGGRF